jgi:hypothetical protein
MTPETFTRLVARVAPDARVRPVLDSVQFRAGEKTFATLGWPTEGWAVVKLGAREQAQALRRSEALVRETGRRRKGITLIRLAAIDEAILAEVLVAAWKEAYRPPRTLRSSVHLVDAVGSTAQ